MSAVRSDSRWLPWHAIVVFGFLYLPIVTLIVYSFNGSGVGGFPPRNLTLDWYRMLFADDAIWESVLNSLVVAFAAMAISLAFGIPAALALDRARKDPFSPARAFAFDSSGHYHRAFAVDAVSRS